MSKSNYIKNLSNIIKLEAGWKIRPPDATDGVRVNGLIASCPPLDKNSLYCNVLQVAHFSKTSALAERANGEICGFVSGYLLPDSTRTLFIWQVAVSESSRGSGLASLLIRHILARPDCAQVTQIQTTVTASNQASRAMFEKLANALGGTYGWSNGFDRKQHLGGAHETEELLTIALANHAASERSSL